MTIQDMREQKAELDKQIAAETHKQHMDAWKQTRKDCRAAKTEVQALVREFKLAEAEYDNYMQKHAEHRQRIQTHLEAKPSLEDFPTDGEMKAWENKLKDLQDELTGPIYQHAQEIGAVVGRLRLKVVEADAAYVQLQYAEQNARARALGENASYSSASTVA